jgi:hypothetical protein
VERGPVTASSIDGTVIQLAGGLESTQVAPSLEQRREMTDVTAGATVLLNEHPGRHEARKD